MPDSTTKHTERERPTIADALLTKHEVAAMLSVTPYTILVWRAQGRFPNAVRLSSGIRSPWRIPLSDVEAFIANARANHGN